jgi:uncharacterized membrane protein
MATPSYNWRCYKCDAVNEAGCSLCGACGFTSNADGRDIAANEPVSTTVASNAAPWFKPLIFFPEGLFAILAVLAAPVWIFKRAAAGEYLSAALLLVCGVAGVYVVGLGLSRKSNWITYLGVMSLVLMAWVAVF